MSKSCQSLQLQLFQKFPDPSTLTNRDPAKSLYPP